MTPTREITIGGTIYPIKFSVTAITEAGAKLGMSLEEVISDSDTFSILTIAACAINAGYRARGERKTITVDDLGDELLFDTKAMEQVTLYYLESITDTMVKFIEKSDAPESEKKKQARELRKNLAKIQKGFSTAGSSTSASPS